MRICIKFPGSCLFFLFLLILSGFRADASQTIPISQEGQIRILLPETTVVEKEEYLLGEISKIYGLDSHLTERLRQVKIGRSPMPGRDLVVTDAIILSRIRSNKINTKKLVFPGSRNTRIQRASLKIPGVDIDRTVMEKIIESYPDQDIKPRILAHSRDLYLPRGTVSYRVINKGRHLKVGGYQTYEVEFSVDGRLARKVSVRTYIKIYKDVVVAKDTIKRNQVIAEKDLLKTRRNVDRMPAEYVTDVNEIIGKVASRAINPNEVIHGNSVAQAPVIKTGDQILIVYESPNLKLTAPGISLQDGVRGDRIKVSNLDSKIMVYATVKDRIHVYVN